MEGGWIKLYRGVKQHWLWKSGKFQWWADILLTVNHTESKVLIRGQLYECKRGQSIRSLESWARDWNVTKKTVKAFLDLLQRDDMIRIETIQISTRITVCKYDEYQDVVYGQDTASTRPVYDQYTMTTPKQEEQECKEGKEEKKNKKELPIKKSADFIDQIILLFSKAYEEVYNLPYETINRGKERAAAGKLAKVYSGKYPDSNTDDTLEALRGYFESVMTVDDAWIRNNMSLTTVMTKFNEINNILKNGKTKPNSTKGGATAAELASLMARRHGINTAVAN
jgi:hypothetical protein